MHSRFGLTLVVNHACNLRCAYCYTGEKFSRRMTQATGQKAIDRALRSLVPGGTLELSFFGGEPLLEAELILELVNYSRSAAAARQVLLSLAMTTNGTLMSHAAWAVMLLPEMQLAVSHDGLPQVHDRHRLTKDGQPSSRAVERTIAQLRERGKEFRVVMVVRPDNCEQLCAGMEYLYACGVRQFVPSLDLWTAWTRAAGARLQQAIRGAAEFWRDRLPECGVSWFDEKAVRIAGVPVEEIARCGFGVAEIAVTPAGNLYPCERLVGADTPENPMRLAGDVFAGEDFLAYRPAPNSLAAECSQCSLQQQCSTSCRCSNYVRSGDTNRPDGLLCLWDQTCHRETVRVLESRTAVSLGGT